MSHPTSLFSLGQFLEKEKLKSNGSNFVSWYRTLRILLVPHKMTYVLDGAIGDEPAATASDDDKRVYQSKVDDSAFIQSGMLYAMEAHLQKRYERMSAYEIVTDLLAIFEPPDRSKRYEASELFFSAKMEEHNSVSEHVVNLSDYV